MKATKSTKSNDPIDRFVFNVQTSMLLCRQIMSRLEDHYGVNPEEVNWGHVGSAGHVRELLEEVAEFMGLKKVEE